MEKILTPKQEEAFIEAACDLFRSDDIDFDKDPKVSEAEEDGEVIGVWVQAWVWVNAEEVAK